MSRTVSGNAQRNALQVPGCGQSAVWRERRQPAPTLALVLCISAMLLPGASHAVPPPGAYCWGRPDFRNVYELTTTGPGRGLHKHRMIIYDVGTKTFDGHEYRVHRIVHEGLPGTQPMTIYYRSDHEGIYTRPSLDAAIPDTIELPLPPTVGKRWAYVQDDIALDLRIVALKDLHTADAVYRDCVKVAGRGVQDGRAVSVVLYYAPHVGIVKSTMQYSTMSTEIILRGSGE